MAKSQNRAVAHFAVAALLVSVPISVLYVPIIGGAGWVVSAVALATASAAAAAWRVRAPLADAKWEGQAGRAARLGVSIAVTADVGFSIVFGLLVGTIGPLPMADALAYGFFSGVFALLVLVPVGAVTGLIYEAGG